MERLLQSIIEVHKDNDVGEIEMQTAEPLIHDPTLLEVETAVEKLKITNLQTSIKSLQN